MLYKLATQATFVLETWLQKDKPACTQYFFSET